MLDTISTQAHKLVALAQQNHKKESLQNKKSQLITITSGKGGVGKSTFSANIAYLLTQNSSKVCIVDADIGLANMQVLLGVKPKNTLYDYIENRTQLENVFTKTQYENLDLVAGKSGIEYSNHSNSYIYTRLVQDILAKASYDYVIVDTGAGLNDYVKEFLSISDNIVALTTTDPSALTDMYALMKLLSIDKNNLMLCFNHTKKFQIGQTICESLVNLGKKNRLNPNFMVKYIGNVETCGNISTTGRLRKLFTKEFEKEKSSLQLRQVVQNIIDNIRK